MTNSFDNHILTDVSMRISFPIMRILSTYNTKNMTALPLVFLYTNGSSSFWMKSNILITSFKMSVLTPRCLLESIYGPLQLADFAITITRCEIQRLLHIDIFLKISIQEDNFHIDLSDFIIIISCNSKQSVDGFSMIMDEKIL